MGLYRRQGDLATASALETAVLEDNVQDAEQLVQSASNDPDALDRSLYIAVHYDRLHLVKLLLKHKARPHYTWPVMKESGPVGQPGNRKQTALHLAAEDRNTRVMKVLVEAIADADRPKAINVLDTWSLTPLHAATHSFVAHSSTDIDQSAEACSQVVKCLLDAGADPIAKDWGLSTPAHYAYDWLQSLQTKSNGANSSFSVAQQCCIDAMQALYDVNPEAFNIPRGAQDKCWTPLHLAAQKGLAGHIEWLLDHMSTNGIARRDTDGHTAWDFVCTEENLLLRFLRETVFSVKQIKRDSIKFTSGSHDDKVSGLFPLIKDGTQLARKKDVFTFELNNTAGLTATVQHLRKEDRISTQALRSFIQDIYYLQGSHAELRFREPSCIFDVLSEVQTPLRDDTTNSKGISSKASPKRLDSTAETQTKLSLSPTIPNYLSLVFPYFHGSSLTQVNLWRNPRNVKQAFAWPDSFDYCLSDSLASLGICMPLTLDEYCNPVLPVDVLRNRNTDQVTIWKEQLLDTTKKLENSPDQAKLIVVSQVWLWNIENIFIGSPFESAMHTIDPRNLQELRLGRRLSEDGDFLRDHKNDGGRRIGLILSELVNYLDQRLEIDKTLGRSQLSEPILNTYEMAITLVSQKVNVYVKTKTKRPDIDQETDFLHKINDIREELSMIKRIIAQQEDVWREYTSNTWPWAWPKGLEGQMFISQDGWAQFGLREAQEMRLIMRPQAQFEKYRRRIAQIDEDAERVERSILISLDIKSKHASLDESHATAIMSAAVLGFTVITIIFTPLAFLTSLFALDPFKSSLPTKVEFGKWAATTDIVSLIFTAVLVALAIEYIMKVPIVRSLRDSPKLFYNHIIATYTHLSAFVDHKRRATAKASNGKGDGGKRINAEKRAGLSERVWNRIILRRKPTRPKDHV